MLNTLSACWWDSGSSGDDTASSRNIEGAGIKGPLANSIVTVYTYDATQTDFKGNTAATATTDSSSAISGLTLPFPLSPPYIIEFTSDSGTTDVTTGLPPVIGTLRSVITQTLLDDGEQIYASPLTTMAVDIAISRSTEATTAAEFEIFLTDSAKQVVSTLGFGMSESIDIFDTPPLIDDTTTTATEQSDVAAYRSAIEAVTAITFEMEKQSTGDVQTVLSELSMDLADGEIDGMVGGNPTAVFGDTTLDLLSQTPGTLVIPNTDPPMTVADVQKILVDEKEITESTTPTEAIDEGGSVTTTTAPAETNSDTDGDGTLNIDDAFPQNPNENKDSDGDGIGDNTDLDDDNNGILDTDEGSTPVPTETDTDGDGILNDVDNCVSNYNPSQTDTDTDGAGNVCDTDDDDDGILDTADAFPTDNTEQVDTDGDGVGNNADTDDDNDMVLDTDEDLGDFDSDGIPNSQDTDSDNDGVLDNVDADRYNAEVTFDTAPISASADVTLNEDTSVDLMLSATEGTGNLTYTVTTPPSNGTLTGTAPNLSYTPSANYNGSDSVSFTATDEDGRVSNTASINIEVTSVNDLPTISGSPTTTIDNGTDYTFTPTGEDAEGEALTYSIENTPVWANFAETDGTLSGTPALSDAGNTFSNIIISVTAGSDTVALPAFSITVNPVITGPASATWNSFNWDDGSTWQ
jgi:hypothetical protein